MPTSRPTPPNTAEMEDIIRRALAEDIGSGDHSGAATVPADATGAARLLVKQAGVVAGVDLALAICALHDPRLKANVHITDGSTIAKGDIVMDIEGPSQSILLVERTILNFMQRMSGTATLTRAFVDAVAGTGCRVLDTRKTTPTLRVLEKWAVRIGGGTNHRFGLYDMVMIKDNHADMVGGIPKAIRAARAYLAEQGLDIPIEVETRDLREVQQVLDTGGVHRIMLDNFTPERMREAVEHIAGAVPTEASGGITLATARSFAETGVDFISVGALTHSAGSLDLSLKAVA